MIGTIGDSEGREEQGYKVMTPILTDCDGVLLNWERGFRLWLEAEGISRPCRKGPTSWNMDDWVGQPALPLVEQFNASEKFGQLEPMPHAVDALIGLWKKGHPLFVLTSCSSKAEISNRRQANLERHFGKIFNEIVCLDLGETKEKHLAKKRVDLGPCIWVEDHPGHGAAGYALGHKVFMKRHPHNRSHESEFSPLTWCDDWRDVESHIMGEKHETLSCVRL